MKIYDNKGDVLLDVQVTDNSYIYSELNNEDYINIEFYANELIDIPIGSYITFDNRTYTLYVVAKTTKINSSGYLYDARFEGIRSRMKLFVFHNTVDGRTSFSLTATPLEHLKMLIDNLNERDGSDQYGRPWWRYDEGKCLVGEVKTITYDSLNCFEALQLIAGEFGTEFDVFAGAEGDPSSDNPQVYVYREIVLNKIEYGKDAPLAMGYGRNNGFKSEVTRIADDTVVPVGTLYVKTSDKNINASKYGHTTLQMPVGNHFFANGKFESEWEDIVSIITSSLFIVPEGKNCVYQDGTENITEGCIDCTDIYPQRVGSVSYVEGPNYDNTIYTFADASIPENLDYSQNHIGGDNPTIVFQTGMLAGKEFRIEQYIPGDKVFKIVPQTIDGVDMPSNSFPIAEGDKYIVYGIAMPDTYIFSAEREVLRRAINELLRLKNPQYLYNGQVDGLWAENDWTTKSKNIRCGGYIHFEDLNEERLLLRIESIKSYINNPYNIDITFGDRALKPRYKTTLLMSLSQDMTKAEVESRRQQIAIEHASQASKSSVSDDVILQVRGNDTDPSYYITLYGGRAYAKEQAEMLLGKDTDSIKNTTTLKGLKSYIQKVCNQFVDVDNNVVNMLFYGGAADTDVVGVNIGVVLSFVPNNNFLTRYTIHADDEVTYDGQTRVKITPDNYSRYPGTIVYLKDIADGYDAGLGFALSVGDMILATERGWKKIGGDNDYIRSLTINGASKIPDANGDIKFDVVVATFIDEYSADDFMGVESIAINSDFFHKVQSAIRDGKLLYIKSFEDATLGHVPFLVEEEDLIYYTIYTAAGFVINGNISEDTITVSNVKHVSDFTAPFLFYWYTLDQMFIAYQNGAQLEFNTDAYDELERAIRNNTPIFIKEGEASHIQLNVKCNEVILLSAIGSGGGLTTAEVYRDKIIVTNFTRVNEDISTLKRSLPYYTEFSYEGLIEAANSGNSINISEAVFDAIDLNRRIIIPIVESRSYYNVRHAAYSAGNGFYARVVELEIAVGDVIKRFILNCYLSTDGYDVSVNYIDTKLCASTDFKTIFGDSIIGEGDVLGEYTLDIQNTGTYHVESIANARIVRGNATIPINIDEETHIGYGPSVYVTLSQSGELQVRGTIGGVYLSYLANGTIKDDFIPSTIARTADIKQPDWNESDSSSNAYINNRTHYYSPYAGEYQLVVDDTTKGTNVVSLYDYFKLGGAVYKSADMLGVEFNCQKSDASVFVTVVEELDSDGNPGFYLRHISGNSSAGAPIMISPAGTVKTIDSVFIPDTVARYSKLKTINGQSLEGTGNIVIQASGESAKWEVRDITYSGQFTTSITITNRVNPITDKVYYKATATTTNVIVNSILPVQGTMTECKIFIPSAGTTLAAMTVSVNQGINAYWETPKTVTGGAPCELTLRVVTGGENPILLLALKELTK